MVLFLKIWRRWCKFWQIESDEGGDCQTETTWEQTLRLDQRMIGSNTIKITMITIEQWVMGSNIRKENDEHGDNNQGGGGIQWIWISNGGRCDHQIFCIESNFNSCTLENVQFWAPGHHGHQKQMQSLVNKCNRNHVPHCGDEPFIF